jgi:hypothetical protein
VIRSFTLPINPAAGSQIIVDDLCVCPQLRQQRFIERVAIPNDLAPLYGVSRATIARLR